MLNRANPSAFQTDASGAVLYDIRYEGFEGDDALESNKYEDELATLEEFEVEVGCCTSTLPAPYEQARRFA